MDVLFYQLKRVVWLSRYSFRRKDVLVQRL